MSHRTMILDDRSEFASNTPASTAFGTVQIGDVLDTTTASAFSGGMWCVMQVSQTFTSGGAATVAFSLASDAQPTISTDGSATHHGTVGPFPLARLVAGERIAAFALPDAGVARERYLGLLQTTGGAALTGGRFSAFLTSDPALPRSYADNVA